MSLKINHHRDPHSFTVSSSRWRSQTDSLGRRRRISNLKFFQKFLHNSDPHFSGKDFAKSLITLIGEHYTNYSPFHTRISHSVRRLSQWRKTCGGHTPEIEAHKRLIFRFFSTNVYHTRRDRANSHFFAIPYLCMHLFSAVHLEPLN